MCLLVNIMDTFLLLLLSSHWVMSDSVTPWTVAHQASLSFTGVCSNPCPLSQWCLSNCLIHCCPLLLLPSVFPSIRVFSNALALLIRWPKYWSFSFSISPSSEYSGLISFRIDWFGLPSSPRDSQKSFPTLQFKSISSSVLSFLYSPTLPSIHDYCKNYGFD